MTEKKVKVLNRAGIHARPAALIVQAVKDFKCNIYFEREDDKINAKSIMGVITLGAAYGTEIRILAEGEGEQQAVDVIAHLFETKFEED
ncbi:phosphocarrier protein HPr [Spirochaetia bacterium]|nr:phosphocarrier protein HPr [Spirochaetia bacterium]GHU89193.1 phosphocarrier protein HPr [Spirochaetia bacterium]